MPDGDALRDVRAHLDDAHAAADRLVREAQRHAAAAAGEAPREPVPPRGWESSRSGGERPPEPDLQALLGLIDAVRAAVPSDLSRRPRVDVEDIPLD